MRKQVTLILAIVCTAFVYGQKMKVVDGDFSFLKGQTQINVEFDYSNLKLYKDKRPETEYIKTRTAELEEKGRGKGKAWAKKWEAAKELIYAPKFLELMNRYLTEDYNMEFDQGLTDAKYTLIVDATWMYPGYNVVVMRKPAKLSTTMRFIETANRSNVLLEITGKNAPGNRYGGTFSNEDRLGEGYAKTGKTLAGMIKKKIK